MTLARSGLPDDLLDLVVTKLGILGRPEAIEELGSLMRHRRAAVRQRAVTSLSQIRDERSRPLIESGLRDSDQSVRAEAARALGRINARASLALLQRAFERNIPEAAESIGALGDAAAADRLLESVGRSPLSVLLPGFRRFLDRRDLPDPVKLPHRRAARVPLADHAGEGLPSGVGARAPARRPLSRPRPGRARDPPDQRRPRARSLPMNRRALALSALVSAGLVGCMPPIRVSTAFSSRFGDNDRGRLAGARRGRAAPSPTARATAWADRCSPRSSRAKAARSPCTTCRRARRSGPGRWPRRARRRSSATPWWWRSDRRR
ncbi:MAG: HEAT repeat domain-containing protein [Deltaproteobacteria bacterium]|nr:HEAT repeat domain-containing protein [Deltaproteobacteria bacterium]